MRAVLLPSSPGIAAELASWALQVNATPPQYAMCAKPVPEAVPAAVTTPSTRWSSWVSVANGAPAVTAMPVAGAKGEKPDCPTDAHTHQYSVANEVSRPSFPILSVRSKVKG